MISGGGGGGGSGEAPFLIFKAVALQSSGSCLNKSTCIMVQLTARLQRPLSQAHALHWPVTRLMCTLIQN